MCIIIRSASPTHVGVIATIVAVPIITTVALYYLTKEDKENN